MSGSQCGFEGTVDLDSALRDSCLNQLQDVEISLEAELVDSEAEIKIGYIYWVFSMLYHYLYYYVYIPSFWVFLIGIIWYTVARYCTRLFSRQSSFPSGFYGESIIFGWLERTNQRSVVWASRCLKTKLKYNSQVLDIGFGAGLSFDTMIRLLGESFESHCHENKGVEKAEYKVYGIENSEQMIRYCTEKYASEIENKVLVLEKGDALSMSYPNESFDVITVSNFIHLVKDKNAALKEWVRCLKYGGTLAILFRQSEAYARDAFVQSGVQQGFMFLPQENTLVEILENMDSIKNIEVMKRKVEEGDKDDIDEGDILILATIREEQKHITIGYTE